MGYRDIVQVVEIEPDYCGRTFGAGACQAVLNSSNPNKCFNTYETCSYMQAFLKQSKVIKFVEPSFALKGGDHIPTLVGVDGREQEVNIAGYASNIGGLGVRASINIKLRDFPDRGIGTDRYWSERISGAAQIGAGYDPIDRGSFWTKFKARNPNYAGRPLRVIDAVYDDAGGLTYVRTRSYVMDEIIGPDDNGDVTIKAKDILSLADNGKALCPRPSQGRLSADITATDTTFTLSPGGIGAAEYPSSGIVVVGSELMRFTRTGNTMTVTRGISGTQAATHSANDTVQLCYNVNRTRADTVIRQLLTTYGNIPASYINNAEWNAEFNRWGSKLQLSATICKPTNVVQLLGEINQLGVTLWWDEVAQRIRVKLNHPPEGIVAEWNDNDNIMSIKQEDNDDERVTQIDIWTVQIDPTKDLNKENFLRGYVAASLDSVSPNMFGISRSKVIYSRWLNHGDDSTVKIISGRLLNRYKRAPITYTVKLDAKDDPKLTDVITVNSHISTDATGAEVPRLMQVFYRADDKNGSTVTAKLQMFQFDARYGQIARNNYPKYNNASAAQKIHGSFFVGPSLTFSDGGPPYQFI